MYLYRRRALLIINFFGNTSFRTELPVWPQTTPSILTEILQDSAFPSLIQFQTDFFNNKKLLSSFFFSKDLNWSAPEDLVSTRHRRLSRTIRGGQKKRNKDNTKKKMCSGNNSFDFNWSPSLLQTLSALCYCFVCAECLVLCRHRLWSACYWTIARRSCN